MTVSELRNNIDAILSMGDVLKRFIPGEIEDRVIEYVRAITRSDDFLQLIIDDFFSRGPFAGDGAEMTLSRSDGTIQAIDPATLAMIIQLILQVVNWFRNRKDG